MSYQIDFQKPIFVHFIGIGGISMSGLASILLREGFQVTGSDSKASPLTAHLEQMGARIFIGQSADNIDPACKLIVYTAAIHPDNPEFAAAAASGIPMLTRAQLLGQIMDNYGMSVAVAGTHGKTTTTSMLSHIALAGNLDPTISVGGILRSIGGNIRIGGSDTFITEACEYTNSFLSLHPRVGIILNIDADHLDFFKDLDDIRSSFGRFARLILPDGQLIINGAIPDLEGFTQGLPCRVVTFGTENSLYHPEDIRFDEQGFGSFTLWRGDTALGRISLNVPGMHNITNACAAAAAAEALGANFKDIQSGLASFEGTDRRFELKGRKDGVTVIDDYAHHPTEISATLSAARNYPHKKIWCVFQPHTYTRTRSLLHEFADALSAADHVVLADIYAAREVNTIGISSKDVADLIAGKGTDVIYLPSFDEITRYLREHTAPGDLVLTMGAGDIWQVGEAFLGKE